MDKESYEKRVKKHLENVIVNYRTTISATSASVVGTLVGYPFDSIKTRMQTYNYGKMTNCIKLTYRSEGVRGFFRGVCPPLVTVSIVKSISFSIYNRSKDFIDRFYDSKSLYGLTVSSSAAGAVSGYVSAIISCPLELIKMQRQIEQLLVRQRQYSTTSLQTGINIFKANGIRGLYRGFLFQGFRDAIGTGSYFCAYEITKKLLTLGDRESTHVTHFFAGGFAGIASWICIFPIDLVKSKLQIDVKSKNKIYKSQLQCIKQIYKTSGVRGFYHGISSCLIRAFPVHALNFVVYEHVLRLIKKLEHESEID
ncbi:mitochondrial carrier [Neocallimastix lanati (nom. inval.)]|uniref:Mitochondrial carrier n=1 Tax=Neocallimastix californiae TaxID=1754190 RepID=A0A1Y2DRX6_9FUNG|nr:mitochondrial carrier [Neocallimastix sp. JGI-2020a]ORY62020.1 mitochondrial carrier [Neocallimastix californiae]|eukprot:ORY62020.1 mitochondrial carrier [Neocallimastix californiae]